ncbi:olfactory protein-like isoform X1 [Erythrolamprus reginae]|uniref:olfactory protein-like isoform X1 n=1 Tax=Erythrolamprus reginae TaxID=121349 RepID=UPI00396C2E56
MGAMAQLPLARCPPGNPGWPTKRCPQFLGQWHIHGMASDCGLMMDAIKEPMICNVTSTEEGTFTMATTFTTEYGPMDMEMTYTKQEDGMYKNEMGDRITGRKKMDDQTYAITNVKELEEGKSCKIVSLYSREASVAGSVREAFTDLALEMQLKREDVCLFANKGAATKAA